MTYASRDIEEIIADIERNRLQEIQKAREEAIREERTQQMIKQREGDFGYNVIFSYLAKDKAEAEAMKAKMTNAFKDIYQSELE